MVWAAAAWIGDSRGELDVDPDPQACGVPVKLSQVSWKDDTTNSDPEFGGSPNVKLTVTYQFESSTHNAADLSTCTIREFVVFPTTSDRWTDSPPFPQHDPPPYETNPLITTFTPVPSSPGSSLAKFQDEHFTWGNFVKPYTSNANYSVYQEYAYKCTCAGMQDFLYFIQCGG